MSILLNYTLNNNLQCKKVLVEKVQLKIFRERSTLDRDQRPIPLPHPTDLGGHAQTLLATACQAICNNGYPSRKISGTYNDNLQQVTNFTCANKE
jgi:hypothetical protein